MDENTEVRNSAFFESKVVDLETQVKSLSFDNAELVKQNEELKNRVKSLATRHPQWPQGYRPRKHNSQR
tara:strand:- start:746 stop:952 length:207 start_codon:yes stop_codon:yes gene_type:complete